MAGHFVTTRELAELLGYRSTAGVRMLKLRGVITPWGRRGRTDIYRLDDVERCLRGITGDKLGETLCDPGKETYEKETGSGNHPYGRQTTENPSTDKVSENRKAKGEKTNYRKQRNQKSATGSRPISARSSKRSYAATSASRWR
jgi:hypothetical protein